MSTVTQEASFKVETSTYKVSLQYPSSARDVQPAKAFNKKYNVLIRHEDLIVLDKLQTKLGVTRTVLLNRLMLRIMERFLQSFNDGDARIAIAKWADNKSGVGLENESWTATALKSDIDEIIRNYENFNTNYDLHPDPNYPKEMYQSDQYLAVTSKLKEK